MQASWGDQMRNYVLNPYQIVKDLRTGYEVGNPQAVFDGDIDDFLEAGIRWRRGADARPTPDLARPSVGRVRAVGRRCTHHCSGLLEQGRLVEVPVAVTEQVSQASPNSPRYAASAAVGGRADAAGTDGRPEGLAVQRRAALGLPRRSADRAPGLVAGDPRRRTPRPGRSRRSSPTNVQLNSCATSVTPVGERHPVAVAVVVASEADLADAPRSTASSAIRSQKSSRVSAAPCRRRTR